MAVKLRGFNRISKKVGELEGATRDSMRAVLEESVEAGAETMRDVIHNSGIGKEWKSTWSNPPWENATNGRTGSFGGRIATGEMLEKVVASVDKDSKYRVRGRFGWLRGSKPYMMYQDLGFKHAITGQAIEGMEAMRAGEEEAERVWLEGAERVAKALADWRF